MRAPLPAPAAERGFTLIELLVGLAIFATLSAAAVAVLSGMVTAQSSVKRRLADVAMLERATGVIDGDLGQAVPRITRLENGLLAPAFFARPEGDRAPLMEFVRAGWSNPDGQPRPSLQKVEYWLRANRLERQSYPQLDGARPERPVPLLEGVTAIALRFRDAQGQWLDGWTPASPESLPRVVELTISRVGQPVLVLSFLVAPAQPGPPIAAGAPQSSPGPAEGNPIG